MCVAVRCCVVVVVVGIIRMVAGVAGTVGEKGIERISGSDKEGLLDVNRLDRYVCCACSTYAGALAKLERRRNTIDRCSLSVARAVRNLVAAAVSGFRETSHDIDTSDYLDRPAKKGLVLQNAAQPSQTKCGSTPGAP